MKRIHAFVSGRVQGVFFRWETQEYATKLGIKGWAKNLRDGRVEVVAEGKEDKLEELIKFLHKGPQYARVTKVEVNWEKFKGKFDKFFITY
ncbi:MAG: acylphosphatase [Candidatus Helarchaeota archaeon]|nr:acylphosphatase [Candidatus Helarchaeota archaeon]